MLKVVYVVPSLQTCGGIKIAFEHCNRLRDFGVETFVYSTDGKTEQDWFDLKAPIVGNLKELNPDVVIATFWKTVFEIEKIGIKAKKLYLVQGKERYFTSDKTMRGFIDKSYQIGYELIAISKAIQDYLKDDFGLDSYYIPNGLDFSQFYREVDDRLKSGRQIVLVEGNSDFYYKNVYQGLVALQSLRPKIEVWYLAYNPGKIDPKMYDRLFTRPDQNYLRKIYSSADIILKPTLLEGSPLPIMEAMACGTCVVASDIDSVREYCVHDYNAVLCNKADVNSYRRKIKWLLNNKDKADVIASNGRKTAEEFFNWDNIICDLKTILLKK